MNNAETLASMSIQDTRRRETKIQHNTES